MATEIFGAVYRRKWREERSIPCSCGRGTHDYRVTRCWQCYLDDPERKLSRRRTHMSKAPEFTYENGYRCVKCFPHPNPLGSNRSRVFEHVLVVERCIGRYLKKGEVVHHVNGIKTDNRPTNLVLTTRSGHAAIHQKMARLYQEEHFANREKE